MPTQEVKAWLNAHSQSRKVSLTDDQMRLIAHALSLVDRDKLNYFATVPFHGTVVQEVDSLLAMFKEDNTALSRSCTLGFCV